jgi:hypothetical protein
MDTAQIETLETLLENSAAHPAFKEAVLNLRDGKNPGTSIVYNPGAPPVKVLRVIQKLLEMEPQREITRVELQAQSGCSDFSGQIRINGGELVIDFVWDCAWRAQQQGWTDAFGYPDQIKAARTYGYQCFEKWLPR